MLKPCLKCFRITEWCYEVCIHHRAIRTVYFYMCFFKTIGLKCGNVPFYLTTIPDLWMTVVSIKAKTWRKKGYLYLLCREGKTLKGSFKVFVSFWTRVCFWHLCPLHIPDYMSIDFWPSVTCLQSSKFCQGFWHMIPQQWGW